MPRDPRLRLADILEAVSRIDAFTCDHDAASFAADRKALDAVAFNLLVIGEAATHTPAEVADAYPEIPWDKMRAIRNVIAHQYFDILPEILWRTAREDLPALVPALRRGLEQPPPR